VNVNILLRWMYVLCGGGILYSVGCGC